MFLNAKSNKVSGHIIEQIRIAILEGRLKPGDKLPTEKELMEKFKVSRGTLREALRSLEILGLLEIRKGISGGPFITEIDTKKARENFINFFHFKNLSLENLFEVRLMLEPNITAKAAVAITEEDLQRLEKLIRDCDQILNQNVSDVPVELRRNEIQFHRIIANVAGNPILTFLLDVVENLPINGFEILQPPTKKFSQEVQKAHNKIYKALLERNARKARSEMVRHIREVEKSLIALRKERSFKDLSQKTNEVEKNAAPNHNFKEKGVLIG